MVAQKAQPLHVSRPTDTAGRKPLLLILSLDIAIRFLGQAATHKPQPLQSPSLMVTLGKLFTSNLPRKFFINTHGEKVFAFCLYILIDRC